MVIIATHIDECIIQKYKTKIVCSNNNIEVNIKYLLLLDSNRNDMFLRSAKNYITYAKAQVKANAEYIRVSELSDIGMYKFEL